LWGFLVKKHHLTFEALDAEGYEVGGLIFVSFEGEGSMATEPGLDCKASLLGLLFLVCYHSTIFHASIGANGFHHAYI
jgi:hypothetical protein